MRKECRRYQTKCSELAGYSVPCMATSLVGIGSDCMHESVEVVMESARGIVQSHFKSAQDHSKFYRRHLIRFVCGYFGLDILTCIMIADPHFYGYINCQAPSALQLLPHWLLHISRLLLGAAGVVCTIHCFGSAWALLQVGILGPGFLSVNGEPCMYPPLFGSPAAVLEHGLKGFWSHTWHQIFRAHFSSIGDKVASSFFPHNDSPSMRKLRAAIRLFIVFFISGMLHACASYTLLGSSNPMASFLCFAVQPVGIVLQAGLSGVMHSFGPHMAQQTSICHLTNATYCVGWLMLTCAPLADDFSQGGTWMLEPVPVSFTRGFGLSSQDDRWLPWIGLPQI